MDRWTDELPDEKFQTFCAADFEGVEVSRRQWLVEGCFPHENVSLLSGDGGLGKTILALMLGTSISSRTPWLGFEAMQGPFVYVGAEDDRDELHRRLDRLRCELGLSWGDFTDFHFRSLAGQDALLGVFNRSAQAVKATRLMTAIETRIADLGAIACVLDTSADVFGGDEISRPQVRQFIGLLRGICLRRKTSIVLLSHPSLSGMASGSGTSGSTAWNNSVRARAYLKAVDNDPDARLLEFMKSNYGPKGKPLRLRWQNGLFVPDEAASSAHSPQAADAMFLRMLEAYTDQKRPVSAVRSANYAPKVFADDPMSNGYDSRTFADAMNRLLASKEIQVEQFGPPSKLRTRIIRIDAT